MARLARETLPDSVVLAGPSHKALEGQQKIFDGGGNLFVDDQLSERDLDLICGTYEVATGKGGMYDFPPRFCTELMHSGILDQTAIESWFPRALLWDTAGLNITAWNQQGEDWYLKRRAAILDGTAGPLNGRAWRNKLRFNRQAPHLTVKMNRAAHLFLQSSQADFIKHDPEV